MYAAQAHPTRRSGIRSGRSVRNLVRFPRVVGGRPFSEDPGDEDLRPPSTTGTDSASPARLPVYPWRNGGIVGMGREGGDDRRNDFSGFFL